MSNIKVLAGDIVEGDYSLKSSWSGETTLKSFLGLERINLDHEVRDVEILTEENKKKFLGSFVGGVIGAAVLGPAGLLAGAFTGGQKKQITFACYLKDGRKFLAVTDAKTFSKIQAACF